MFVPVRRSREVVGRVVGCRVLKEQVIEAQSPFQEISCSIVGKVRDMEDAVDIVPKVEQGPLHETFRNHMGDTSTGTTLETTKDLKVYVPAADGILITDEFRSMLYGTGLGSSHCGHEVVLPSPSCTFKSISYGIETTPLETTTQIAFVDRENNVIVFGGGKWGYKQRLKPLFSRLFFERIVNAVRAKSCLCDDPRLTKAINELSASVRNHNNKMQTIGNKLDVLLSFLPKLLIRTSNNSMEYKRASSFPPLPSPVVLRPLPSPPSGLPTISPFTHPTADKFDEPGLVSYLDGAARLKAVQHGLQRLPSNPHCPIFCPFQMLHMLPLLKLLSSPLLWLHLLRLQQLLPKPLL